MPSQCQGVCPLNRVTREVLTDTVTFKQRPERREGAVWVESWEKRSWREAQLGVFWFVFEKRHGCYWNEWDRRAEQLLGFWSR